MRDLSIIFPVLDSFDVLKDTLDNFIQTSIDPSKYLWIFIDNGSKEDLPSFLNNYFSNKPSLEYLLWIYIRFNENQGVSKAFNEGWRISNYNEFKTKYLFFSHTDVRIHETGWDTKLINILDKLQNYKLGVTGFFGATGLGTPDIYKTPYQLQQLVRVDPVSNIVDWKNHGRHLINTVEPVAVLDGFSQIVPLEVMNTLEGFDEYYKFHMYDEDLHIRSLLAGYINYVINIRCEHLGGRTSTRDSYLEWSKPYGGDQGIHENAHKYFYEKFKNKLPIRVKFINMLPIPIKTIQQQ